MACNEPDKLVLNKGKLPVMEIFSSIQGEGFHTGKAALFIRIGGCDIACNWCDVPESWNGESWPLLTVDEIINKLQAFKLKSVVITGGEPLKYDLSNLCYELRKRKYQIYLETSGSYPISGSFDWVCLSPKSKSPPNTEILLMADELKIIIENRSDFNWAEKCSSKVKSSALLYLQPEWSKRGDLTSMIIDYIDKNPKWILSLQTHKYIGIP